MSEYVLFPQHSYWTLARRKGHDLFHRNESRPCAGLRSATVKQAR